MKERLLETAEQLKSAIKKDYIMAEDNFRSPCIIFQCSYQYAKNRLLKNGFYQCPNPSYISNGKVILHSYNSRRRLYFDSSCFAEI